jgi:hypothetical protein
VQHFSSPTNKRADTDDDGGDDGDDDDDDSREEATSDDNSEDPLLTQVGEHEEKEGGRNVSNSNHQTSVGRG